MILTIAGFALGALLLISQATMIYMIKNAPESNVRVYLFPELDLELVEHLEEPEEPKYIRRFWAILDRILHP
jgi:hypothetical protein